MDSDDLPPSHILPACMPFNKKCKVLRGEGMSSDDNRELAQDGSAKIKRHSSDHGKSLVYNRDDSEDDDFKPSAKRKIRPIDVASRFFCSVIP